jgi:hypothetical protein
VATLTYVKGLPTPAEELNSLGFTEFEMFLTASLLPTPYFYYGFDTRNLSRTVWRIYH